MGGVDGWVVGEEGRWILGPLWGPGVQGGSSQQRIWKGEGGSGEKWEGGEREVRRSVEGEIRDRETMEMWEGRMWGEECSGGKCGSCRGA